MVTLSVEPLVFKAKKETKGTWVYEEVPRDGKVVVGSMYIKKGAFASKPKELKVTIEGVM